jgi:hypothetical protein
MSRTTSIKNAASKEKRDMSDDTAYKGTMTMIRTTILKPTISVARANLGGRIPLEKGFSVVA